MNTANFSSKLEERCLIEVVTLLRQGNRAELRADLPSAKLILTVEPCSADEFDIWGALHFDPNSVVAALVRESPVLRAEVTARINDIMDRICSKIEAAAVELQLN